MMMESVFDPFDSLFANEPMPSNSDGHLLNEQIILDDFNFDPSPFSPTSDTMTNPELNFDIDMFQKFLDQLISSDSSFPIETSFDILPPSIESEPATREMGTDPMVEASPPFQPPAIQTTKLLRTVQTTQGNHSFNQPIIIIQSTNKASLSNTSASTFFVTPSLPTKNYSLPLETSAPAMDYSLESFEPMSPSTSNDSFDEPVSSSPDTSQEHHQANMVTNLAASPKSGPLVLTNEELKLIKQEGYQAPTKLPLSKSDEKMLKRIQRKIKNKISAQESRRKKKEYVDALEKQIAKYVDENTALKERMTTIEKSQKTLAQERDLLRSMIGKGATAAPSTALMVFVLFFAVLFGIWSPITMKPAIDDRSLSPAIALAPSSSYLTALPSQPSLLEQQKSSYSNPVTDTYKSRVLLSVDEQHDQHHHGPYLPYNRKYKSSAQSHMAAPGYTYSKTVEKYMNKKIKSIQSGEEIKHFKRSISDESSSMILDEESGYKKRRPNYHPHENVVIIEETQDPADNGLNESKSVKIIRVERTIPAIGNDTLKLVHHTANE